tara:strand:+ start:1458 stop:3035 length:1578 start_codon:yes stop_codon:yes gene_type:complete
MRSLVGKVIEIKNQDLNKISGAAVDKSTPSVVLFNQTKDFTVERQKQATFNIMNPRKVIFMGSASGNDATTRSERREEELENRRKRKNATLGLGASSSIVAKNRKFDPTKPEDKGDGLLDKVMDVSGTILTGIGGGLLARIPFLRPLLSLSKLLFKMGKGGLGLTGQLLNRILPQIPTLAGGAGAAGGVGGGAPRPAPATPRPVNPVTDMSGPRPSMSTQTKPTMSGRVADWTKKVGGKGGRLFMRALGPLAVLYEGYEGYRKIRAFEEGIERIKQYRNDNSATSPRFTHAKIEIRKEFEGMKVADYHIAAAKELANYGMSAFSDAKKTDKTLTESDWVAMLGPHMKFANPDKFTNLTFGEPDSIQDLIDTHMKAAAEAGDKIMPGPKDLQQKMNENASRPTTLAVTKPAGLLGSKDAILDQTAAGPIRLEYLPDPTPPSVNPVTGEIGQTDAQMRESINQFLNAINPTFKKGTPSVSTQNQNTSPNVLFSDTLTTRDFLDTDIADQTIRTNHGIDFTKSQYVVD